MNEKQAQKRIEELRKQTEYYAQKYYDDDAPEISDFEYDMLMVELRNLEKNYPQFLSKDSLTQKVGGHVKEGFEKVTHEVPLQSLQDIFSFEEVEEFCHKMEEKAKENGINKVKYVVETKIDGLSSALEYKDGILKVKKDGLYGLIDLSGSEIVGCEYSSITTDGYYNTTSKYEQAGFIVTVRKEEGYRYGYINNKGKPVLDTIYTNIKRITEIKEDDNVYLLTYRNGKAGMLKNGQTIIENEFENIEYDSVNAILAVQKNAKQGIYDLKGKEILPIRLKNENFPTIESPT